MSSIIAITLGGVELPPETAAERREVAHARVGERALIEDGAGSLLVVERWSGREITVSGTGQYPPGLSALSRAALVGLTYHDLEADAERTVQGLIVRGPTWDDAFERGPTSRWALTLRELSALGADGGLSVGGVAVPLASRVLGVTIRRAPERAFTLLQLADGTAVPQLAWQRWRYVVSGRGWVPPGIAALGPESSITLVSVPFGTVACWLVSGPDIDWSIGADGPGYAWSITLQSQTEA